MELCTIVPFHTGKTTGSVTTQGGGSSSHRNPRIDALHGQSSISLPPSRFHQRMHYSWSIKYITVHRHSIYAPEKLYRVVQDGSSVRSSCLESCIHCLSRNFLPKKRQQFSHKTPIGPP